MNQFAGFVGRAEEIARLVALVTGQARLTVLTGAPGVGKSSLLRAGATPVLARQGFTVLTLTRYDDLERELIRAASPIGVAPPIPGQEAADYIARVDELVREADGPSSK